MAEKFRKEKLSRKSLDDLAKRNIDTTAKRFYTYTTVSGEKLQVDRKSVV